MQIGPVRVELRAQAGVTGLLSAASAGLGTLVGYAVGWQQGDWRLRFEAGDRRVGLRVEVPVP